MAQRLKRLPGMQETWVRSLGREDPLEKEMATHSSTLAWRIPWTEEPGGLQSTGSQRVGHDWTTSLTHSLMHLYSVPLNLCFSIWKHMQKQKITKMLVHLGYIDLVPCDTVTQLRTIIFCHTTHTTCGILVLLPGIQPAPLALEVPNPRLNHWTTGGNPKNFKKNIKYRS